MKDENSGKNDTKNWKKKIDWLKNIEDKIAIFYRQGPKHP